MNSPRKNAAPSTKRESRSPIVVVVGHIDHGKTTLLDHIREANVAESETGGITQRVSAYEASISTAGGESRRITFLDTPGHEAFSAMRLRGTSVADLAILVVSAIEGVQVQTLEALNAITAAQIPYVVAINKIDKPEANLERAKQDLAKNGIFIEGYGGVVPAAAISAKTGEGVPELLELVLLTSDMQELTADPTRRAEGVVIESHHDARKGASATLIVKDGTLVAGTALLVDGVVSPLRMMQDFLGKPISSAQPSAPVIVAGLATLPPVGVAFQSFASKKEAEAVSDDPSPRQLHATSPLLQSPDLPGTLTIPLVVKAESGGALDAALSEIAKIKKENVAVRVVWSGVGMITENDVRFASAAKEPVIIGFGVSPEKSARDLAERLGIVVKRFDLIYDLAKYTTDLADERRPKTEVETPIGKVKIIKIFSQTKDRQIVGGSVIQGLIAVGKFIKIMRHGFDVGRGKIVEVQHQKIKMKEVAEGNHFGAMIECRIPIAKDDTLEVYGLVTR